MGADLLFLALMKSFINLLSCWKFIATTVSGQGVAEHAPLALGVVGSNGGVPSTRQIVDGSDVFIYWLPAGSVTTERWRSPKPGVKIIHIDSD